MIGAVCGLGLAGGLLLVASAVARRRPHLADRVAPYLQDLPHLVGSRPERPAVLAPATVWWAVFGPSIRRLAGFVGQVLGGSATVRRRLARVGSRDTVEQFRVQQVLWGLAAFAGTAGLLLVWSLRAMVAPLPGLIVCVVAFAAGVLARDQILSRDVREREQRMVEELPTVADLMALAVAAGEGPMQALERVVATSHGALSVELRRVLGAVRTGTGIAQAFDDLAARTALPSIARFSEGLAIAVERGTPLVDVLHAQAADAREAGRRSLIEAGARKEVTMMIPVVFLILPVTIVFAFWPGVVGLNLVTP
jgi:tight adherence protein C